nr:MULTISPECIES: Mov34/MPN/PAD-1 family protein [Myxococcaceae]
MLAEICRLLERAYPEEGCGVVLEGSEDLRATALRNAAAGDPRLGFAFEPGEWLALCRAADARGERVACVFHSHPDGAASLSAADRAAAAPGGQALLPGTLQLVVAVNAGRAGELRAWRFEDGDFREAWRTAAP